MDAITFRTVVDGEQIIRPPADVVLPEGPLEVTVKPVVDSRQAAAAWQSLRTRIRQRPVHGGGKRYTRDELHERR